ncbi:MAG: sulfate ABC transporter ATP-binding protein [Ruminococcus sp.]|nr:sulfate ABC transporter ATP-binding protein [Ruminococcus sp.]
MYVELKNINKYFGDFKAADDVNFSIEKGKLVALLGPSGSGKTTILRMIAGLEKPDSGEIYIDGKLVNNISASERGIGFVFQSYALFRYMTVFENIAFGLEVKKIPKSKIKERVNELIELVGLKGMEKRYPNQLSGGQRQRVAFARALAPEPTLLLLDEPFAAIDAKVRAELRTWLADMIHKVGITSIFVTHDQDEAVDVADNIIVTNKGRIEQHGTPQEIYKDPKTPFVAEFIGNSSKHENYGVLKGFSMEEKINGALIRPEFVEVFKSDNASIEPYLKYADDGVVEDITFRGNAVELLLDVKGLKLTALRSLERRKIDVGERVKVLVYRLYAFDNDGVKIIENSELAGKETVKL